MECCIGCDVSVGIFSLFTGICTHSYRRKWISQFDLWMVSLEFKISRDFRCHEPLCDRLRKAHNHATAFWSYILLLSKVIELGDTAFIVLRKQKLVFLHWYHHVTTLMSWWVMYSYYEPNQLWYIVMNSFVHSLMYTYYALRVKQNFINNALCCIAKESENSCFRRWKLEFRKWLQCQSQPFNCYKWYSVLSSTYTLSVQCITMEHRQIVHTEIGLVCKFRSEFMFRIPYCLLSYLSTRMLSSGKWNRKKLKCGTVSIV